jgi:glycosyltransferase involved in cell wall biosynthesis
MIVKNSGEVLRKCLKSIKPHIDHWTILDTGSTDQTPDIIKQELNGVPGQLFHEPFVDFSTSRNRAFELSPKTCKYMIVLDDSYVLHGGSDLRECLPLFNEPLYSLKIGTMTENKLDQYYFSSRLVKSSLVPHTLYYKGRVHEAIYHSHILIDDKHIFINDIKDSNHAIRSSNRLQKDIDHLLLEEKDDPTNPRTYYYLIRYYVITKEYPLALQYCDKLSSLKNLDREYQFCVAYEKPSIQFEIDNDTARLKRSMIKAHKKFPERSETMYKVAVLLYNEGQYSDVAYITERLLKIKPPTVIITIMDTSIYDYYIPYLHVDTHFKLGQFEKAIPLLRTMLEHYPSDQPLLNMKYTVCDKTVYHPISLSNNATVVIHMGYFYHEWDPKKETKISGSEYMAMNMAKQLTKLGYRVFVFGQFESADSKSKDYVNYQGTYQGVQYIDLNYYQEFSLKYNIDYLIISRHVSNLTYYDNIKNVYLWVHDILPFFSPYACTFQFHRTKFKGLITLSNWQKEFVQKELGVDEQYMILSRNAIFAERFMKMAPKIPFRFIYIADASRGLEHLIHLIPKIKERYPQTTLSIFCKTELIDQSLMNTIELLDYVALHPRVSQDRISSELLQSDIWLYPTHFRETYCISALEAMAAGCLVATVKYAGLKDTVGDRGIMCDEPIDKNYDSLLEKLFFVLDRPEIKERYVIKAREWALQQTYENLALEWRQMFESRNH